ncbi:MAG TPA: tRNA pseudouridine(55) synthase TruB [Actinomycetota bacterium]|nr:tRNA pseudouridine(55) synthase TruB [Actinomycetota bacterium]
MSQGSEGIPNERITGVLLVDKPPGCTSHDVVDRVRRIFGLSKVGHAGTLDPAASGLLLLGLGKATRILAFLQGLPKSYRAEVQFGVVTTSQDADGEVVSVQKTNHARFDVEAAAARFQGEITQLPPMYSAVKVGGKPLYRAARKGEEVERSPRTVRVYDLQIEAFDQDMQVATMLLHCSSGTYVRTLAADLGDRLGGGAHLSKLRRLSIGSFGIEQSTRLQDLEDMGLENARRAVISMREAMRDFPQVRVEGERLQAVTHGRPVEDAPVPRRLGELPLAGSGRTGERPSHQAGMTAGIPVAMIGPAGELIAVYRRSAKGLRPAAVLL